MFFRLCKVIVFFLIVQMCRLYSDAYVCDVPGFLRTFCGDVNKQKK